LASLGDEIDAFHAQVRQRHIAALGLTEDDIQAQILRRKELRDQKLWADADQLRADLLARGVALMDTPEGTTWRVHLAD
jgi:cysteinyl-tRNA synthetase